ncbi:hypothetical protein HN587_04235 [Candidatus Woesearchaeota archaeon]|jgi:nitroreductase|nr:hypothetical protein [Candidatus Woesearchaeota archaeon]
METFEAIEKRRTCRKYLNSPIEWEKVGNILLAGSMAPSAGNLQDWKFIVVTNKQKRRAVAEACMKQFWMEEAPVHIIICAEPKKSERFYGIRGEKLYSIQNIAAASENMIVAATDQGLSTAWVGAFDEDKITKLLNIPKYARPQVILTIGYSGEGVHAKKPGKYRLVDMVFLDGWGGKISNVDLVLQEWSEVVRKQIITAKEVLEEEGKSLGSELFKKSKQKFKELKEKAKAKTESVDVDSLESESMSSDGAKPKR